MCQTFILSKLKLKHAGTALRQKSVETKRIDGHCAVQQPSIPYEKTVLTARAAQLSHSSSLRTSTLRMGGMSFISLS